MIYIDPPYNTGNKDFKYNDSFVDKEDSFRHSKWLSFMEKRLKLAKELLTEDGVIFISIDNNEACNLKLLTNDIFGEKHTEMYVWGLSDFEESSFTKTASNTVRIEHEFIIAGYKKNKRLGRYKEYRLLEKDDLKNIDNDPRGDWFSGNISRNGIKTQTGSKYFTITTPTGVSYTRNWTLSKQEYEDLLKDNRIYFSKNGDGVPRLKKFKNEPSFSIQSSIFSDCKTSITGKNQLKEIFNNKVLFDFPKPTKLINRLVDIATTYKKNNSTVCDFMAGSGTTGHAVMELNKEDGGNRQFILCTNNENNICEEVTYERIKRVMQGYTTPKGKKVEGLGGELKYLKTHFVKKQKDDTVTDEDRIKLTYEVGCVLALKENTFDEVKKSTHYQIFSSSEQLTAIYFSENKIDLSELVDYLSQQDKPCKLYLFSWTKGEYKHEFSEYDNIVAEDIPEPILDVYKNIGIV